MSLSMSPSDDAVGGPWIVVLGPPGSGKGTHARRLAERYDVLHLSTGALLRREMTAASPLGVRVASTVLACQLVDDAAIVELVRAGITSPAARRGWVLDGAPRSVGQAQLLTPVFAGAGASSVIAVALDVPEPELRLRLAQRGEREGRADDTPAVVEQRLEVWAATGPALLEWYGQRSMLARVNGVGSVDEVFARVVAAVERRLTDDVDPAAPDPTSPDEGAPSDG